MKQILFFILTLYLASCATLTRQMHDAAMRGNLYAVTNGLYVRDVPTGLCYLIVDAYQGASLTMVPCDSLKRISVKNIYITRK